MAQNIIANLGPLAPLAGIWEGAQGDDLAPSDTRGTVNNKFREKMIFKPFGPVNNHEQVLYGLNYSTTAWRLGEAEAFHEDMGYWLWDAQDSQVIKCFVVPRGVSILAGGTVKPTDKAFTLTAKESSDVYGLCHNRFLEKEFKIVSFELSITIHDSKTFSYAQNTMLRLKGKKDIFHHRDQNTLKLVGG